MICMWLKETKVWIVGVLEVVGRGVDGIVLQEMPNLAKLLALVSFLFLIESDYGYLIAWYLR